MKHTHLSLFPGQILPTHKAARHKFIIKIMCFIAGSENTQKIKSKTANVLGHVKNGIFHCRKAALIVKKKGGLFHVLQAAHYYILALGQCVKVQHKRE